MRAVQGSTVVQKGVPANYRNMLAQGPVAVRSDAGPALVKTPYVELPARIKVAPTQPQAALTPTGGRSIVYNIPPSHSISEAQHTALTQALDELTQYRSSAAVLGEIAKARDPRELLVTTADLMDRHKIGSALVNTIKNDPASTLGVVVDTGLIRSADKKQLLVTLHDLFVNASFELDGAPMDLVLSVEKNKKKVLVLYDLRVRQARDAFRREIGMEGNEEREYARDLIAKLKKHGQWENNKAAVLAVLSPELAAKFAR